MPLSPALDKRPPDGYPRRTGEVGRPHVIAHLACVLGDDRRALGCANPGAREARGGRGTVSRSISFHVTQSVFDNAAPVL
jgi:hypothetical protein